jgi:hypothetical protein
MNCLSNTTWRFLTLVLSAAALILSGCDSDSLERPPPNASLDLSAGTNRLLMWNMQDGKKVTAFGEKTSEGGIDHLTGARIQFPEDENPYQYAFDEKNRPTRVRTANGAEYQFSWREDGTARVNFRAASDTLQVSFVFDPDASADSSAEVQSANVISESAGTRNLSVRDGRRLSIEVRQSPHKGCVTSSSSKDDLSPSIVNVSKCGGPVDDADVTMYAIVNGEDRGPISLGSYAGGGRYAADVPSPSDLAETVDRSRFCEALQDVSGTVCDVVSASDGVAAGAPLLCNSLSAAIDLLFLDRLEKEWQLERDVQAS